MRKQMMLFAVLAIPAVFADGDPRSFRAAPAPPSMVQATPLPAPVASVEPSSTPPAAVVTPPPVVAAPVSGEGFGSDTRYWVASQIAGDQGVTELRPQSGEVATHVFDRYVKSFDYAIPETYQREGFGTSGASTR